MPPTQGCSGASSPTTASQDGAVPKKKIKLKLEYNGSRRVAVVYEGYTFARLHKRLCEDFKFDIFLEYEDSEGDKVMLNCENDLSELLENEQGTVRVQVAALQDQQPLPQPQPQPQSPPPPPRAADPDRQYLKELQLATEKQPPPPSSPSFSCTTARPSPASAHVSPLPANSSPGRGWRGEPRTNVLDRVAMSSPRNGGGGGGSGISGGDGSGSGGSFRGRVDNGGGGRSPLAFGAPGISRPTRELGSEGPNPWQLGDVVDPVRWLRGDVVGEGAFGTVHMGLNLDTGELMAVKSIDLDQGETTSRDAEAFVNEVAILRDNRHENIVRSYGSSIKGKQMYIFLEFMPGGSVRLLLDRFGAFPDKISLLYAKQMLRGLSFLHANGVAHRDIKCANCLVDHRGSIKLADFGVSKRIVGISGTGSGVQSVKGTPFWMAPEVLQVQNLRGGWMKADVWSFGATLLEMCSGSPPWGAIGSLAAMFKISCTRDLPAIPDTVSRATHGLMRQCFCRDPSSRPDADELLRHPGIAAIVSDHTSAANSSAFGSSSFGGRAPRQQTTAVPAAAREQGLQMSRNGGDLSGGDISVAARDAGGTSDSDSSVGAISHPGYMHEAVSRPLDLLTTKPQARIKWGSIDGGGGGGGGVSAAGNTKPPTVVEGRESQTSSRDSRLPSRSTRSNSSASAGGANDSGDKAGSNSTIEASVSDVGNVDTSERASSPVEAEATPPSRKNNDAVSCNPASLSSSSAVPLTDATPASLNGGGGSGGGSKSTHTAGRHGHRGRESGPFIGSSSLSSSNTWSKATSSDDGSLDLASAAAAVAAASPLNKSFGSSRREWSWRDGAPVPGGGRVLTPTNSPVRSPRTLSNEDVPTAAVNSSGNVSYPPLLGPRGSGSWGFGSRGKVGIAARATEWKRRIQERGLESEAERMASAWSSARGSRSSATSDGATASDASSSRLLQQYALPPGGSSSTSSSDRSLSAPKPKPKPKPLLFQAQQERRQGQAPRRGGGAGHPVSPPSRSITSVDLGSGGGGGGGTSDGAADRSDGVAAAIPGRGSSEGGVAGSGGKAVPGGIPPNPRIDGGGGGDSGDSGIRSSPVASASARPREVRSAVSPARSPAGKSEPSAPLPSGDAGRVSRGDEGAGGGEGGGAEGSREGGEGQERRRPSGTPELTSASQQQVRSPPRPSPKHAPKA